jgi:cytidylate kinase
MQIRLARMMERLHTDDYGQVESEVRTNDEAHAAVIRRHFGVEWTDSEHYDVV